MPRAAAVVLIVAAVAGCSSDEPSADTEAGTSLVADIRPAIEAIEDQLGTGQQFFEITATAQVTNLFVAVDDATAAVPYVFFDDVLQPPAPTLTGASGFTFTADAVDFDEDTVLDAVATELPDSTIETFSIEGGEDGAVRYVVTLLSQEGGRLDVTVAADGAVLEVDPI